MTVLQVELGDSNMSRPEMTAAMLRRSISAWRRLLS
jgi:hypothetical protein